MGDLRGGSDDLVDLGAGEEVGVAVGRARLVVGVDVGAAGGGVAAGGRDEYTTAG